MNLLSFGLNCIEVLMHSAILTYNVQAMLYTKLSTLTYQTW